MNCVQIEESNEMGMEVLPAVEKKGKLAVHPMPEVVLPPTAEEEPKTPTVGNNERMEDPPAASTATTTTTMRRVAQLTSARVQAEEQHRLLLEGDGEADDGRVTLDQGWVTFVTVHQIKIGYMVTLKLLTPDTLKVIIFDDDGIEVVNMCGKHDEAFATRD
ncbi:hypothetical protein VPH35_138158 [Triticum aestivum]